jgi:hypothetical protein
MRATVQEPPPVELSDIEQRRSGRRGSVSPETK